MTGTVADPALIQSRRVAIVGYGSQGHAHALNLRDSGVDVCVVEVAPKKVAEAQGERLKVLPLEEAILWADTVMLLVPDTAQASIYHREIAPRMKPGKTLMFAHGFNIRFGTIVPSVAIDVSMIAPMGPGHRLRELYLEGGGTPALIAVHQDPSGKAKAHALSYAWAIGVTRGGVLETTFAEETETDLFGEQAVLCGGTTALIKAAFETLVEGGYQPEIAYFACLHELKLIVDLLYRGGANYMRYSVSDTAEHGDYTAGPKIITEQTRAAMKELLAEIQSGAYAKGWIEENAKGRPWFNAERRRQQDHPIERIGAALRSMMPFISPVEIKPGD
jgi:ketol-acid reductoisomerase